MAHPGDSSYVRFHPEKLGLSDVFSSLVLGIPLNSHIVETNDHKDQVSQKKGKDHKVQVSIKTGKDHKIHATLYSSRAVTFKIVGTLIIQKILLLFHDSLSALGGIIELMLNFLLLNGGVFRSFFRFITVSIVRPKEDDANYRSINAFIGRRDNHFSDTIESITDINHLELCCRASELAYENKNRVEDVVNNKWNAHFVQFYQCGNDESLSSHGTEAFICSDREENARLIVLAFRGTEIYNLKDWATDIDLSWVSMDKIGGRVHEGFMKALGYDTKNGCWPENYTETAYYSLRNTLEDLLEKNKNAKLLITGHSLGGALAILFPAILLSHGKHDLVSRLHGIYTFGQPRVGDAEFGKFMEANLNVFKRYHRMVYGYDIVTRIPFDLGICGFPLGFAHFGECLYYDSWYKGRVMVTEVNKNYFFEPWYALPMFLSACLDLVRALLAGIRHGSYFREPLPSIGLRIFGIVTCPGFSSHSLRNYKNSVLLADTMPIS